MDGCYDHRLFSAYRSSSTFRTAADRFPPVLRMASLTRRSRTSALRMALRKWPSSADTGALSAGRRTNGTLRVTGAAGGARTKETGCGTETGEAVSASGLLSRMRRSSSIPRSPMMDIARPMPIPAQIAVVVVRSASFVCADWRASGRSGSYTVIVVTAGQRKSLNRRVANVNLSYAKRARPLPGGAFIHVTQRPRGILAPSPAPPIRPHSPATSWPRSRR